MDNNPEDLGLILIGAVIGRRVQKILGYEDEALALAVVLAVKQVMAVIDVTEGNPFVALDEFEKLEEAAK